MSKRLGALLAAATVAIALVVAGAAFGKSGAADCGDVTINENAWAGSTANVYVAKYVLEKNLGCDVEVTKIAEIPVFQALADGKVDAVLEDWQHVDQYKQFISKQKSVVFAGKLGVVGHIGWYIPQYLNAQYKLAEVKLPARFKGCQDDASSGGDVKSYRCAYDVTVIMKTMSKDFATSGSPAVAVLKRFTWTNKDQELVAKWIAGDKLSPEKAAERWVKANPGKVKAWLGR
jgi:ABC-type proline/glycine betaine transport system substrate-binding protein